MHLPIFQVDAFSQDVFGGNPAAVVPLDNWIDEHIMQQIASENNLSETAFFTGNNGNYHIRWFTPLAEVDLCGHATLATAHIIYNHLHYDVDKRLTFESRSGPLQVAKVDGELQMSFPVDQPRDAGEWRNDIEKIIGSGLIGSFLGKDDFVAVVVDEDHVKKFKPDLQAIKQLPQRGLIVTARGQSVDFVSRCFFPRYGIDEDPVTGSAHTILTPLWAKKLGKTDLKARQVSQRGGRLSCQLNGDRVLISGHAVTFMEGKISI